MSESRETIGDIFRQSPLVVPEYQRGYSWDKENIEDLTDDLTFALKESVEGEEMMDHYFGTVILETNQNGPVKIVDGQQRIISIMLLMDSILKSEHIDLNDNERNKLKHDFIGTSETPAIDTNNSGQDTLERMVYANVPPTNLNLTLPAEINLQTAKKKLIQWVEELPDEFDESPDVVLNYLKDMVKNHITLTIKWVDNPTEAGRIFETINDRGKDLTIADKIKSYLMYVCDRKGWPEIGEDVLDTFGEILQRISSVVQSDREEKIETFIKEHWRLFSGEAQYSRSNSYEYTQIHRKLKKQQGYASLQRDDSNLKKWIKGYLSSLSTCIDSFCILMAPEEELKDVNPNVRDDIITGLKRLNQVILPYNTYTLLMAVHQRFEASRRFVNVIDLLEVFGFRAFEVCRANRNARRTRFRRIGFKLYYAISPSKADIYAPNAEKEPYEDLMNGYLSVCYDIENAIGAYGNEQSFENNLRREDVINGGMNDEGWNGFRNEDSILYFLIDYNNKMYDERGDFTLDDIKNNELEIEHIWPANDSLVDPRDVFEHRRKRNSLGNLGFLPKTSTDTEEMSYEDKYRQIYSLNSSPAMMRQLPNPPESSWGATQVDNRLDDMVDFGKSRWEVNTRAHVQISDDVDDLQKQEIRRVIRDWYENYPELPSEFNNIPRIDVSTEKLESPADFETSCPACGDLNTEILKLDSDSESPTELQFRCGNCDEGLSTPSVSFVLTDHV